MRDSKGRLLYECSRINGLIYFKVGSIINALRLDFRILGYHRTYPQEAANPSLVPLKDTPCLEHHHLWAVRVDDSADIRYIDCKDLECGVKGVVDADSIWGELFKKED
jgi:hypothetical protein